MRVDVRRPGIDLELADCDVEKIETCKNADDLEDISYRVNECDNQCYSQLKANANLTTNGNILQCHNGICKDYSSEYTCPIVETYLDGMASAFECNCTQFSGNFYQKVDYFYLNGHECPSLDYQLYLSCEQVRNQQIIYQIR